MGIPPQHCLVGAAKQTFKNTARRDGFNVWRALVLRISSQTDCRRFGLRDRVQSPPQAANNSLVDQALADWETLYSEYQDAGGIAMDFEEAHSASQDLAGGHSQGRIPQAE